MLNIARHSLAGLRILLVLTVITGLLYPLAILAAGRAVPGRADGSLVRLNGQVVGSRLLGQEFAGDGWFQTRPSAAGDGYDTLASAASNLGPENADLLKLVTERRPEIAARDGVAPAAVPADALTASGSGLDPDISPAYARIQVVRVATATGLDPATVGRLVTEHTQGRDLGILGAPHVNVMDLNLALRSLEDARR